VANGASPASDRVDVSRQRPADRVAPGDDYANSRGAGGVLTSLLRLSASAVRRLAEPVQILLANQSLAWLVAAFAFVTIAEWGYVTALAVDAFRVDGAIAVGIVGLRLFFAALSSVFSLPLIHRRPGRHVLTAVASARAGIVGLSALLAATGAPFDLLLVLVAVDAVVSALYRPAQSAMLPGLARTPTELAASAAGLSTVKTLSQAAGAIAGGFLLVVFSPSTVFAGSALVFVVSAVITTRYANPSASGARAGGRPNTTAREIAKETLSVVREPHVAGILTVSGLRTFVRGMWIAMAVIASLRLLHAGSQGVGLLMVAAGVGSLVAVPLSAALVSRSRIGTPAALALIACGIPLAFIAGIPVLDVALVMVAAWGIAMAVADVATLSLLHRLLDTPLLPRVTGAIESAKLALEGLGAFLAPFLVSVVGIRGALVAAAVPLPVVVVAGWGMLHRLDASASERSRILALVHGVPCLSMLDMAALDSVVRRTKSVSVPPDTEIIRQGDHGDMFYVVESGSASVLVNGFAVGRVDEGASFGEKALLRDVARTATVKSVSAMKLLCLSREDFLEVVAGERDVAIEPVPSPWPAHAGSTRRRSDLLARVSLLSHLDSEALADLAERSVVETWPEGSTIVRRGEEGDRFYVLLDGRAMVKVGPQVVAELHPGDQFGEIALLHGVRRRADVATTTAATTLSLHRDDFVPAVRSRLLLG
jgi:CRP-like cAMP-binding protein